MSGLEQFSSLSDDNLLELIARQLHDWLSRGRPDEPFDSREQIELFRRYFKPFYEYVRLWYVPESARGVSHECDAEEIASWAVREDTMRAASFRRDAAPGTFLFAIAKGIGIDHFQRPDKFRRKSWLPGMGSQ